MVNNETKIPIINAEDIETSAGFFSGKIAVSLPKRSTQTVGLRSISTTAKPEPVIMLATAPLVVNFFQRMDKSKDGKLALAAVELFNCTSNQKYLDEAIHYGTKAGSDYWWSAGDINSLADYKIAKHKPDFAKYIYQNLKHFKNISDNSFLREGLAYSWGTTNALLGVSLQSIIYKKLTSSTRFDSLAIFQRDYILGRNPWGVSFIYNVGSNFSKHLHSQVAFFNNGYLPGALTAGPAPTQILDIYKIKRINKEYDKFNTDSIKYYDDRFDYITNEPTIIGNATALFVFGCYSN